MHETQNTCCQQYNTFSSGFRALEHDLNMSKYFSFIFFGFFLFFGKEFFFFYIIMWLLPYKAVISMINMIETNTEKNSGKIFYCVKSNWKKLIFFLLQSCGNFCIYFLCYRWLVIQGNINNHCINYSKIFRILRILVGY